MNGPCGNGAGWPIKRLQQTRHSPPRWGLTAMRSPTMAIHSPRSSFSLSWMAVSGPMSVTGIRLSPACGAISCIICLKRWALSLNTSALMILLPCNCASARQASTSPRCDASSSLPYGELTLRASSAPGENTTSRPNRSSPRQLAILSSIAFPKRRKCW